MTVDHTYTSETCWACNPSLFGAGGGGGGNSTACKFMSPDEVFPGGTQKAAQELVNSPAHYGGKDNPHEHWKCMVGSGLVDDGFLYNCTKYLWRFGKKDGAPPVQDLEKARWYLDRAIELAKSRKAG